MANVRLDGLESLEQRLKKPALFKVDNPHQVTGRRGDCELLAAAKVFPDFLTDPFRFLDVTLHLFR
jgi:hypothetical protein